VGRRTPYRALTAAALALAAALAIAACGGDDAGSDFDQALSFLPADAPVAITLSTDIDGEQYQQLGDLIERFPGGDQVIQGIQSTIEQEEVNFEEEIRPLLGSQFVIGAPDVESLNAEEDQFVAALPVQDSEALVTLIEDQGATEAGEVEGATIYESEDGGFIAVDESVAVFADTQERLEAALEQSSADESLSEDAFDEALGDLPEDALVRVYADVPTILAADPEAEQAQEVAWVDAVETIGLTASAVEEGLAVDLNVATNPDDLSEDQLPIAPGAEEPPPVVAEDGDIGVGLRDPSQVADFVQLAAEEAGAGEIELAKSQIEEQLGVDLDEDVIGQLTGEASVSVGLEGDVGFRSELADPGAFEDTLDQISQRLPQAASGIGAEGLALEPPSGGSGLYTLRTPDGPPLAVGVVGGLFVAAQDEQQAQALAAAAPEEVPGAEGSVTMSADASAIAEQAIAPFALLLGDPQTFVEPLGDLTGSLEADTSGLRGQFLLTVE
jgi:Protein of unknown function (DUF3352)